MDSGGLLFETWDGDETDIVTDLSHVLKKHGFDEGLAKFLTDTLDAHVAADGSTSEFLSSMFVVYKTERKR